MFTPIQLKHKSFSRKKNKTKKKTKAQIKNKEQKWH